MPKADTEDTTATESSSGSGEGTISTGDLKDAIRDVLGEFGITGSDNSSSGEEGEGAGEANSSGTDLPSTRQVERDTESAVARAAESLHVHIHNGEKEKEKEAKKEPEGTPGGKSLLSRIVGLD